VGRPTRGERRGTEEKKSVAALCKQNSHRETSMRRNARQKKHPFCEKKRQRESAHKAVAEKQNGIVTARKRNELSRAGLTTQLHIGLSKSIVLLNSRRKERNSLTTQRVSVVYDRGSDDAIPERKKWSVSKTNIIAKGEEASCCQKSLHPPQWRGGRLMALESVENCWRREKKSVKRFSPRRRLWRA